MASGDSRRSSNKGKKLSSSFSSNDDEVQWLLSDNESAVNADVNVGKPSKNSSHQNFSNVVYNGNPLIEALVTRDEARKRMLIFEEVFSDDLSVPHSRSVPSSNFPVLQPSCSDFNRPLTPLHGGAEIQSVKLKKEECRKDSISRSQPTDRNVDELNCKSNRLVEKKQSEDKLMEQRLQEMKLQMKSSGQPQKMQGYHGDKYVESLNIGAQVSINPKVDVKSDEQNNQSTVKNIPPHTSQSHRIQSHFLTDKSSSELPEIPQASKTLLTCVDSIRKRACSLEHPPEEKNMSLKIESNPDDLEENNIGQQQVGIELERKKMKNILVELEEKNMINQELIRKLAQLQEESLLGSGKCSSNSVSKSVQLIKRRSDVPLQRDNRETRKRIMDVASSTKRDNVRKELNSGFPARRHYEAEGRANEDPIAANPGTSSHSKTTSHKQCIYLSQHTFDKIRLIQNSTNNVEELKDILLSYLEQENEGIGISERTLNSQLDEIIRAHRINSFEEEVEEEYSYEGEEEENQGEDEDGEVEVGKRKTEIKIIVTPSSTEINDIEEENENNIEAINICEKVNYLDRFVRKIGYVVHNLYGHLLSASDKPEGLDDFLKNSRCLVQSLTTHFNDVEDENRSNSDNTVRSSGEGSNTLSRRSFSVFSGSENVRSVHTTNRNSKPASSTSDNLQSSRYVQNVARRENSELTQQNIASFDSHLKGVDRNLHKKECSSHKKENNLTDKMGRFRYQSLAQNTVQEQHGCSKENLDSMSLLNSDLNHSNNDETERKTILDILRREKKSDKVYERNQDSKIGNYSAVEFVHQEPLSGSPATASAPVGSMTSQTFMDENVSQGQRNKPAVPKVFPESRTRVLCNLRNPDTTRTTNDSNASAPRVCDMTRERYQQVLPDFIQQLKRQVDQLTELFTPSISDQELINPNLNQNYHHRSNQNMNSTSYQTMSVPPNQYNQHLLLCLTQCYHNMYLQQLEIQQLQHILHHIFRAQVYRPANSMGAHASSENVGIHPFGFAAWLNPVNVSTYSHAPQQPVSPTVMFPECDNETLKYYPPFRPELGTGTSMAPPVRCNIRQPYIPKEEKQNGETLNNQVPPRTRANNFLDNFRSYSRLNLLSASTNVKRNESPQTQTDPSVLNESSHYIQDDTHTDGSTTENDRPTRDPESPLINEELQAFRKRSKKANADSTAGLNVKYRTAENQKKSSLSNINPDSGSVLSERHSAPSREFTYTSVPPSSSVNVIHSKSQEESKLGNFSSILPTSSSSSSAGPEMPTSEFLVNLYKEAKLLTNDMERHNALKLIHDIVLSDKSENDLSAQSKVRNDHVVLSSNLDKCSETETEKVTEATDIDPLLISEGSNGEVISNQSAVENSGSWLSQPFPSVASPMKNAACTGAVRKKPRAQKSNFSDPNSHIYPREKSARENGLEESNFNRVHDADYPSYVVNVIIPELKSFLQNWFNPCGEGIFTAKVLASLNAFIVSKVANYLKMPPEHYTSLYNVIEMNTAALCGKKFADWETKYIDHISHFLYESATSFIQTGQLPLTLSAYAFDDAEPQQNAEVEWSEVEVSGLFSEHMSCSNEAMFYSFQPVPVASNCLDQPDKANDSQTDCVNSSLGDTENECRTEAENEPETEAGTEADLAEADQSPGQQGNVAANSSVANICHLDSNSSFNTGVFTPVNSISILNGADFETKTEISHGAHYCPDTVVDDVYPDDIPTKLCSTLDKEQEDTPSPCVTSLEDVKDEVSFSVEICDVE